MKKEINTKRALIALLLAALLLFAGCAAEQPPDGDGDSADPAPADSGTSAKTIKLARNIYDGVPDVPAVGAVKYTSLSQLVLDNIDPDEEMYFIVGVTAAADKTTEWKNEGSFDDHFYKGTVVSELMQREGWQADPEGMPMARAEYYSALYGEDHIPGSAKYLESFGIELCCRPYSYDWQYHINLISQACTRLNAINGTMSYLVKCTKRELDSLAAKNDQYGLILYISDSEGRYIYCNDDTSRPDIEQQMERKDIPIEEKYKDAYKPHIFYSFDDAGIYTDLICKYKA